jgi:hypothetical protein
MKTKLTVLSLLIVIILLVFYHTTTSSQGFGNLYLVKLYEGEKVIGSWQSINIGQVEGGSLIFTVKGDFDLNPRQVRIQGVYTVEQIQ